MIIVIAFGILLAIPIVLTIYRMYYDPLTPHLWRVIKKAIRNYFTSPAEVREEKHRTMTSREVATEMYKKSLSERQKVNGGQTHRQRPARPLNPPQRPPSSMTYK